MLNRILIRKKREELGYSEQELANIIGVSKVTISGYETGERRPNLEKFERLITALNISADEGLGRKIELIRENDEPYGVKISSLELAMLNEIRNSKIIYEMYLKDPKRANQLINKALTKFLNK